MSFQFHHSCVAVVRKYSCLHQDFLTGESGDERVEGMQHSGVGCRRDHVDLSEQWIFTRIDVGLIRLVSDRVEIIFFGRIAYFHHIHLSREFGGDCVVLVLIVFISLVHRHFPGITEVMAKPAHADYAEGVTVSNTEALSFWA